MPAGQIGISGEVVEAQTLRRTNVCLLGEPAANSKVIQVNLSA